MFDLDKIISFIKTSGREIFLVKENGDPLVVMTLERYQKIMQGSGTIKTNVVQDNNQRNISPSIPLMKKKLIDVEFADIKDMSREKYADEVKKSIMPDIND